MQDLHSDDNDDDSEDGGDHDMDSDAERPAHTHLTHHQRRSVSLERATRRDEREQWLSGCVMGSRLVIVSRLDGGQKAVPQRL